MNLNRSMYFFKMAASNGITEKVARLWVDDLLKLRLGRTMRKMGVPHLLTLRLSQSRFSLRVKSALVRVRLRKFEHGCVS